MTFLRGFALGCFAISSMITLTDIAYSETLTLGFVVRPGFAEIVDGKEVGAFLSVASEAVKKSGIEVKWMDFPQTRLIENVRSNTANYCAVGLYKTDERAAFSKFSEPFSRDMPLKVIANATKAEKIRADKTFADLTKDQNFKITMGEGFVFGRFVDDITKSMTSNIDRRVATVQALHSLAAANRIDYFVGFTEEFAANISRLGLNPDDLALISFPDFPQGATRHFMCSKAVDDATLAKLNAGIASLDRGAL